jgi:hypothetical protein
MIGERPLSANLAINQGVGYVNPMGLELFLWKSGQMELEWFAFRRKMLSWRMQIKHAAHLRTFNQNRNPFGSVRRTPGALVTWGCRQCAT